MESFLTLSSPDVSYRSLLCDLYLSLTFYHVWLHYHVYLLHWGPEPLPAYCAYNVPNILSASSTPGAKDMANERMQEWMIGATGASLRQSIRGMTWPLPVSQSPQGPHSLVQPHWAQLLGPHRVRSCTGCVSYVENLSLCATSTHPAALGLSITSSRMPSPSDHHHLNPHQSPNRTN